MPFTRIHKHTPGIHWLLGRTDFGDPTYALVRIRRNGALMVRRTGAQQPFDVPVACPDTWQWTGMTTVPLAIRQELVARLERL